MNGGEEGRGEKRREGGREGERGEEEGGEGREGREGRREGVCADVFNSQVLSDVH